jgi:drug/metabolite transporter (DMT)-like permease
MIKYVLLAVMVAIGSFGQIMLKLGVEQSSGRVGTISSVMDIARAAILFLRNYYILGGVVLYGIGFFLWLAALTKFELSYAYPIMASVYIFILLLSWLLLGEHISAVRIIGTLVIAVGIAIVAFNK